MKSEGESQELAFLGTDPGAVKFGNFINYYSFHNVEERTSNLHANMFPKQLSNEIFCLDIGCNTGELTKEIYHYLKRIYTENDVYILGIDIDPTLIKRAQEFNNIPDVTYITANIMEENGLIQKYLSSKGKKYFDITFCFSVTMWIHLNNGDDGLTEFLRYIKNISRAIIIEPQPWNCYRNAQRRLIKSGSTFLYYQKLKIRSNVDVQIEKILLDGNFQKVYESLHSSWKRKIQSYHTT